MEASRTGEGPGVLFVHGSAVDAGTWAIQAAQLSTKLACLTYTRRVGGAPSVEDHARDALALCDAHRPVLACGSSFGAVVVLELLRRAPSLLKGAVLIEPPLAPADDVPPLPAGFLRAFDALAQSDGGPAAGDFFLEAVLGEEDCRRLPKALRARAAARWEAIREDCGALERYPPRYAALAEVSTPVLLLGGARSLPRYHQTLEALRTHLPHAVQETVPAAGHMMHVDQHRRFNQRLVDFVAQVTRPG